MLIFLLAAAAATPTTTLAPPKPGVVAPDTVAKAAMPSADDFVKMMKLFDKIFPPQPEPDPARLGQARGVAQAMWPNGLYGDLTDSFLTAMADMALDMKPSDFEMFLNDEKDAKATKKGKAAPKPKPKVAQPDVTLREKMRRDDPNFDRRVTVISEAVREELKRLSPIVEPPLREGLARSLARRFTSPQLADLQAFFASPTGQAYARESVKMWFDSDIIRASMNSMPALVMHVPGMMERVKAAADTVPPPPAKAKPVPKK